MYASTTLLRLLKDPPSIITLPVLGSDSNTIPPLPMNCKLLLTSDAEIVLLPEMSTRLNPVAAIFTTFLRLSPYITIFGPALSVNRADDVGATTFTSSTLTIPKALAILIDLFL